MLVSGSKRSKPSKKSLGLDKTYGSDYSMVMSKEKAESEHDKSADKSVSKTMISDNNDRSVTKDPNALLEREKLIEENAKNMVNDDTDEDELDKEMMSAVSEFDTNKS